MKSKLTYLTYSELGNTNWIHQRQSKTSESHVFQPVGTWLFKKGEEDTEILIISRIWVGALLDQHRQRKGTWRQAAPQAPLCGGSKHGLQCAALPGASKASGLLRPCQHPTGTSRHGEVNTHKEPKPEPTPTHSNKKHQLEQKTCGHLESRFKVLNVTTGSRRLQPSPHTRLWALFEGSLCCARWNLNCFGYHLKILFLSLSLRYTWAQAVKAQAGFTAQGWPRCHSTWQRFTEAGHRTALLCPLLSAGHL